MTNQTNKRHFRKRLFISVAMAGLLCTTTIFAQSHIRLNQVGYHPGDKKVALIISNDNLEGQSFSISGSDVSGKVGKDRGSYAKYSHVYEADFSALKTQGSYTLKVGNNSSCTFKIGNDVFRSVLAPTIGYLDYQHCDASCHNDAIAEGGPKNGQKIDVTGAWHDAANPPKLVNTFGFSVLLLLLSNLQNSSVFSDVPAMAEEAKRGLTWLNKMWDPSSKVLYAQIGDPDNKDENRRVLACKDGKGANVAGRAAAALALGSVVFNNSSWLKSAKEIYEYGKTVQRVWSCPWGFYPEDYWQDDMALAAAELYRATKESSFLSEAKSFISGANNSDKTLHLSWEDVTPMANYELARLDESFKSTAISYFEYKFQNGYLKDMAADKFDASQGPSEKANNNEKPGYFTWASIHDMANRALEAFWHFEISKDPKYIPLAVTQRDYIMGRNPWGFCFINRQGTNFVKNIYWVGDRTGWWAEGPASKLQFEEEDYGGPELGEFDTDAAIYRDEDNYVFNEPTISGQASGAALITWFYKESATGVEKPTTTAHANLVKFTLQSGSIGKLSFSTSRTIDKINYAIYQVSGKLVCENTISTALPAGNHTITAPIALEGNGSLPAGTYLMKVTASSAASKTAEVLNTTFIAVR